MLSLLRKQNRVGQELGEAKPLRKIGGGVNWRRGSESNRRIKVLQTSPLPLGYRALSGFPLSAHFAEWDSLPVIKVASRAEKVHWQNERIWSGRRDLNPRLRPWQGRTLPLSYSRSALKFNRDPSAALGISAAGSDARQAPQVTPAQHTRL